MLLPFEKRLWSAIPFSKSRTPIPPWGFLLSYITISWYYFCLFMFLWWELEPSICYESHDQTKVLKGWPQRQSGKPITFMASNYKNSTISFRKFGHVGRSWTPTYPRHPWKWTFKLQTHKFNKMTQIPSSFICFHMNEKSYPVSSTLFLVRAGLRVNRQPTKHWPLWKQTLIISHFTSS